MTITGTTLGDYEPMRKNRYILEFPKEIEVPEFCVQKISKLVFNINSGWDDLVVTILPIIGSNSMKNIANYITSSQKSPVLEFLLKNLDPTGMPVSTIQITGSLQACDFDDFDYNSDAFTKIKLHIKVFQVLVL